MLLRKNKRFLAVIMNILLVASICFAFTACSGNKAGESAQVPDTKKVPTVKITDCIGRQVEVPVEVNRIACLYAFSGHVVAMLGKGSEIIAVVGGLQRDKIMRELVQGITDASVPVTSGAINIEELIKVRPDVAFVQSSSIIRREDREKLEKSGIPFLVIDYDSINKQQYAISIIGKAIGAAEKAESYNKYYQSCIELVKKRVGDIPENKRARIYHSVNEATRTDTVNTLPADWMAQAGLINVSVNDKLRLIEDKYYASLEQIFLWDPDAIIANEAGVADYIINNPQWKALRAVRENKVYQMPNGISRWGHPGSLETPLGLLWTVKTIYPDYFKDLDMAAETKKYYSDFFGLKLSDEDISKILIGEGMRIPKGEKE